MSCPEKKERNEQVFHLIECGHSFSELSSLYHISPQRVLQIYNAMFRKKFSHLNLNNKEEKING